MHRAWRCRKATAPRSIRISSLSLQIWVPLSSVTLFLAKPDLQGNLLFSGFARNIDSMLSVAQISNTWPLIPITLGATLLLLPFPHFYADVPSHELIESPTLRKNLEALIILKSDVWRLALRMGTCCKLGQNDPVTKVPILSARQFWESWSTE